MTRRPKLRVTDLKYALFIDYSIRMPVEEMTQPVKLELAMLT
jgi:hypothetical protein